MIQVEKLSKSFGGKKVVDGLSFSIKKGEVVGFLGPNGAGKTTTLRMLTGFFPPSSGAAHIGGFDTFKESLQARKAIGYMPENVPLYEDMRVKEYLSFRVQLRGFYGSKAKKKVGEVMELCGLVGMRRRMIKALSKGYRQRVGLADALVHEPPLLILDEPTNGLDPFQIKQVREMIRELGQKHTILLSTHILSEVEAICERVIILNKGKICAEGTPKNLAQKVRRAGTIYLEIKHDDISQVEKKLSSLNGVRHLSYTPCHDDPHWKKIQLLIESGMDLREQIYALSTQNHWKLRELKHEAPTLEEVFVELTQE